MTTAQLKHFYFPAWNACAKANDWRMERGRLKAEGLRLKEDGSSAHLVDQLKAQVWTAAEQIALQAHRAVTAEDLRHGCTIVALSSMRSGHGGQRGHGGPVYKSSKDLTNAECDRVVALFRLLTEADDIGAMVEWNDPEIAARKRLVWVVERVPEGYVRAICDDKFGTKNWRGLETWQLRQLVVTLKSRKRAWTRRRIGETASRGSTTERTEVTEMNPF